MGGLADRVAWTAAGWSPHDQGTRAAPGRRRALTERVACIAAGWSPHDQGTRVGGPPTSAPPTGPPTADLGAGAGAGARKVGGTAGVAARMTGVWVLLAVLAVCTAFGLVHRSRSGRLRLAPTAAAPETEADAAPDDRPDLRAVLTELGEQPGERATLLQFSSAFCAPCRATRRVLGEVAALVEGVRHVEVDAESHLDVVRRLGVARTPTTIVLDADGRETGRATGQPRTPDVLAAIGHAVA